MRRYFDTDQHITPPPNFYDRFIPAKFKDVSPRVVTLEDGSQAWSFDGGNILHQFGLENSGGDNPVGYSWAAHYDQLHPSYYDATERIKAMDRDGVEVMLLFASTIGAAAGTRDDELYEATFKAYNSAVIEWAAEGDGRRILPAAIVPVRGMDMALAELKRVHELGFKHFTAVLSPSKANRPVPADEPFWDKVEEYGLVVSMHGGAVGPGVPPPPRSGPAKAAPPVRDQEMIAAGRAAALGVQHSLGLYALTGLLERHPGLKIALIETSAGWLPSYVEQLDAIYLRNRPLMPQEQQLKMLPSEYLSRIKISIDREVDAIRHRERIGVDRIMMGSDYPHIGNYWPHTRYYFDLLFRDVPDEEVHAMVWENGASLYGVEDAF
ncbi:MAG: amidohydrolase family protein [Chloroflexi bacterium]|nr:amidohydrolase family protein [Chloroflexota bacterium]